MTKDTIHNPAKVSIIGAARSGLAAAKFFVDRGSSVFLSDTCDPAKLESILKTAKLEGVPHEAGGNTGRVLDAELIVISPGVPSDIPILQQARQKGIPVWSEIELTYRNSTARILAITGSSGKSTTTSLVGAAIAASGRPSVVAGNIGLAAISVVPQLGPEAVAVLEISSFQLETIDRFRPCGAAILNIMKNHLDRYRSMDEYIGAKKLIAKNLTRAEYLVLNADDEILTNWASTLGGRTRVVFFGRQPRGDTCVWIDGTTIRARNCGSTWDILDTREMRICGRHNHLNACAAAAMALWAGIDTESVARGIASFGGLSHRLEFAGEVAGVKCYNDSKSTTAESVLCAVTSFDDNVHLIAGGRDKGCDFAVVNDAIQRHVRHVYLIGEAAGRMESVWRGLTAIDTHASLRDALTSALAHARAGDVVVFSPGCSSFDMFKDYEHRGNVFKEMVHDLAGK
jgi:UDP-N-acetylmuramoylalanine--D-glutamate ligase